MNAKNYYFSLLYDRDAKYLRNFTIDETNFIFTLNLSLTVFVLSIFINLLLEIDYLVKALNFIFGSSIMIIYWLAYFKHKFKWARIGLHTIAFLCINTLWFTTQASAGPASVFFMAYVPLTIFFTPRNSLPLILALIGTNLVTLYFLEVFFHEWVAPYNSNTQRALNVMIVTLIFLVFEIPMLIFAKEAMEKERDKAINSEERKSSMIANLSHEIRTPMNAILGFTELLSLPDLPKSEQEKYINVISQNGKILLNLLNNIINDSKLETNNIKPSYSLFTVESILNQIYDTISPSISEKPALQFKLDPLPEKETTIKSDFTILYQILLNLCYNAYKFTDSGEITLGYTINDNKNITINIKDTGRGISHELKPHIFKKFRTGDATEPHLPMQGAGLGLAICKGLTQLLNGEISFDSTENIGTTFTLELPYNQ